MGATSLAAAERQLNLARRTVERVMSTVEGDPELADMHADLEYLVSLLSDAGEELLDIIDVYEAPTEPGPRKPRL